MRELEILGEYTVFLDYESAEAIIGHIHHVRRNAEGGQLQVPVAHFEGHLAPGDDLLRRHWAINLNLSSQVRYDEATRETTVVANPERQAGPNRSLLRRLKRLRDGGLPLYHPSPPKELGELLLRESACCEPAVVHIHHSENASFVSFGEVFHED